MCAKIFKQKSGKISTKLNNSYLKAQGRRAALKVVPSPAGVAQWLSTDL